MIRSTKDIVRERLILNTGMDREKADMLALMIASDIGRRRAWAKISLLFVMLVTSAMAMALNQAVGVVVFVWWMVTIYGLGLNE